MDRREEEAKLRAELKGAGWKQGVVLNPEGICDDDTLGLLVLTQTCDCIQPSFNKEPFIEVLPLRPRATKKGKPDPNYENGKNPREIHFYTEIDGGQKCLVANVTEALRLPRENHASYNFATFSISAPILDDILTWRAARYLRFAFPDDFEDAFTPLKDSFTELLNRDDRDALVDSLLIDLDPLTELEEDDKYSIRLLLMVTPKVMGQPASIRALNQLAEELTVLLSTSDSFDEPSCDVMSLGDLTLWDSRNLLNFTRYDYLSFGDD